MFVFWLSFSATVTLLCFLILMSLIKKATRGRGTATAVTPPTPKLTATPTTPTSPPPAAKPVSNRVKWLVGGVVAIVVLSLLWWALPTGSTSETVSTSQSWLGQFISNLDLNNTTLGKPVVKLVGADLAPLVIIVVTVVSIMVIAWLLMYQGGALVGIIIVVVVSVGITSLFTSKDVHYAKVDFRGAPIGHTVTVTMGLLSKAEVRMDSTLKDQYNNVRKSCPNVVRPSKLPFAVKFRVVSGNRSPVSYVAISDDSRKALLDNGTPEIEVEFVQKLRAAGEDTCTNLHW